MTAAEREAVERGGQEPPRFDLARAWRQARERGWPLVMGVVNVTPDSFSDGGRFLAADRAVEQALRLVAEGADIIDVGGESTRPGSFGVSAEQELERILPVITGLRASSNIPVSVDTSKAVVMREAAARGASMINDVAALKGPGALEAARDTGLAVVLMHMQGEPRTMQHSPRYDDVVQEVGAFLEGRARECMEAGIPRARIALDPGFGFGKNLEHNLTILRDLQQLTDTGFPLLVGLSRKSMIAAMIQRPVDQRVPASISLALAAAVRGAAILRVHDVAATVDALRVWARVEAGR